MSGAIGVKGAPKATCIVLLFAAFRALATGQIKGCCGRLACWRVTSLFTLLLFGGVIATVGSSLVFSISMAVVVGLIFVGDVTDVVNTIDLVKVLEQSAHKH